MDLSSLAGPQAVDPTVTPALLAVATSHKLQMTDAQSLCSLREIVGDELCVGTTSLISWKATENQWEPGHHLGEQQLACPQLRLTGHSWWWGRGKHPGQQPSILLLGCGSKKN